MKSNALIAFVAVAALAVAANAGTISGTETL